ncbi:hypothetical protein EBR37_04050 [bacterium]|nr:hypothetical protein [bacterium]
MEYPLCKIVIQEETISLKIIVDLEASRIESRVFLPTNYPNTVLGDKYRDREIFLLAFSIYNKDRMDTEIERYSGLLKGPLEDVDKHCIFIHEFFFYPKLSDVEMTSEEKVSFGGLGKKVMCLVFNLISNKFPLIPERTLVVLEASGNVRSRSNSSLREAEIMNMDKDSLIRLVEKYNILQLDGFSEMFKKKEDRELFNASSNSWKGLSKNKLANTLTYFILNYEDNLILAGYYSRNYGFDIVYDMSFSHILMATNVSTILRYCKRV